MAQAEVVREDTQITCVFTTKLPSELQVPKDPVAVPASLTRYGLSQIINHLLALEPARPFDFLINGELVRIPLEKFLLAHDISAESTLQVEYIFAVVPPQFKEQLPHDDWVSAIDGRLGLALLTGAYDGALRIYSGEGTCVSTSSVHSGPVNAVATLPAAQVGMAASRSGGQGMLWQRPVLMPRRVRPPKKRKAAGGKGMLVGGIEEPARETMQGHSQCVSSVSWPTDDTIISASWDHSVRRWDAETSSQTQTLNTNKAIYAVAASPDNDSVVAFGGAERNLRLWDTRMQTGEEVGAKAFASHTDWIVNLAWAPSSAHHIVTASHDKTLKLWDLRTAVPLHTMTGHIDKVLCVSWFGKDCVASGSADCTVKMYSVDMSKQN
ncbi:hypothetical protein WJX72_006809 [[Myrmecia] bisecta]|uniref:NLE domain-containing protein n=1 Tax=[Myrmecia] bisecta TaxID=41462 RepID=A0AAW1PLT3_9CHLO